MSTKQRLKAKLKVDVTGYNYKTYGKAGEEVTVVSTSYYPVYIIENKDGKRYSTHYTKVEILE